jgi:alkylation response protein AidB-like acyl-CoA dehydrogenase
MIVDLLPTDDQAAIRDSVAEVLANELPVARLHEPQAAGAGAERARWPLLAELGVFGLAVPEADGGVGFGLPEQVTVAAELGRCLISPSVLATMLAAGLAEAGLRGELLAGTSRVAVANPLGPVDLAAGGVVKVQLLDAEGCDHVLVWSDAGAALCPTPRVHEAVEAIDETVSLWRAELDLSTRVAQTSGPQATRSAGLLLAAYLAGNAQATLAMATEYAKIREQFGQPIGAFQAIKHYCAEMARRAEAATSQTFYATLDAVERQDDDLFEVAAARLLAADAATTNGRFNIQIHGAMGFTYEADAHLYLKRALLVSAIAGNHRLEQIRIMESKGLA